MSLFGIHWLWGTGVQNARGGAVWGTGPIPAAGGDGCVEGVVGRCEQRMDSDWFLLSLHPWSSLELEGAELQGVGDCQHPVLYREKATGLAGERCQ